MSDAQFGLLLAAAGAAGTALIAFLRWVVVRITSSWDRGTDALIKNTAGNAELSVRLVTFGQQMERVLERLDAMGEWMEQHSDVGVAPALAPPPTSPAPPPTLHARASTPAGGVSTRARSEYGPLKPRGGG